MRKNLVLIVLACALALVGCSKSSNRGGSTSPASTTTTEVSPQGDIPDNQVFVSYTPPTGGYQVDVPEGWARTAEGAAVTFTDKLNSVRMETVAAPRAPTVASATADELPAIASSAAGYAPGKVEQVARKAGPAILLTYRADGTPDAVTGKVVHLAVERYELWKGGREVVLTLSGPVGADNVDPWKRVTDSLTWR
jgi:hypothetical protein